MRKVIEILKWCCERRNDTARRRYARDLVAAMKVWRSKASAKEDREVELFGKARFGRSIVVDIEWLWVCCNASEVESVREIGVSPVRVYDSNWSCLTNLCVSTSPYGTFNNHIFSQNHFLFFYFVCICETYPFSFVNNYYKLNSIVCTVSTPQPGCDFLNNYHKN